MNKPPRQSGCGTFKAAVSVCACLLLLYTPAAWSNDSTPLGQIAAVGDAEINGVTAVRGGTIFSGDRIATDHDSSASLSLLDGREAILSQGSSFQIARAGDQIKGVLSQGEVAVLSPANGPIVIDAGGTRIVPGRSGSVYAVRFLGKRLDVSAKRGTVSVEAADRTVEVPEGKTLEATLAPAPAQQAAGADVASAIKSSRLLTVLLISTIALGSTALVLLIRDLNTSCRVVSPSSLGKCEVTH